MTPSPSSSSSSPPPSFLHDFLSPSSLLPLLCSLIHLFTAPYTKVEESFYVQAVHDILYTKELSQYDHLEFSGVVPRSFIGPLLLSLLCSPFRPLLSALATHKLMMLIVSRMILSLLFLLSFLHLTRAFSRKYHTHSLSPLTALLTCSQFHILFYCSRPLANTFATVCINMALAYWVESSGDRQGKNSGRSENKSLSSSSSSSSSSFSSFFFSSSSTSSGLCVAWLAFACIVFRCDMVLLSFCVLLSSLSHRWLSPLTLLRWGLISSLLFISLCVCIDSYYWRRFMWAELEVLMFNTLRPPPTGTGAEEGAAFSASSAWGTEPFHWYWTRALPKALLAAGPLIGLACIRPNKKGGRTENGVKEDNNNNNNNNNNKPTSSSRFWCVDFDLLHFLLPILCFIFLYSFLPHKELRFIYPVLPFLNCLAGVGLWRLIQWYHIAIKYMKEEGGGGGGGGGGSSNESKSRSSVWAVRLSWLMLRGAQCAIMFSMMVSAFSLYVSSYNYPGGEAMHTFHTLTAPLHRASSHINLQHSSSYPLVHISNLAAMTGVTRFSQHDRDDNNNNNNDNNDNHHNHNESSSSDALIYRYSKQEGIDWSTYNSKLQQGDTTLPLFDYRIAEYNDARDGYELLPSPPPSSHHTASSSPSSLPSPLILAFDRVRLSSSFPFIHVDMKPALVLLQRTHKERSRPISKGK